ncbi:dipeptide transport ATP-binding protein DppD [Klebsiella pneumoniae]|uniref:Dipeptide transport ATP-binding protein DppD n=1 Tax=Klebsiella pneumoniae TaxID=573 RepID=A0A377V888_KLEPN|nr:dipeptide transport ATP-binding protein DppD [Klebsiella pneumoniae]
MIEVQHLNLAFGEGEKRNQVLYDVSFHVKPGEILRSGRRVRFR